MGRAQPIAWEREYLALSAGHDYAADGLLVFDHDLPVGCVHDAVDTRLAGLRNARSAANGGTGPGYAAIRNCQIRGNGGAASVKFFADGGDGSTVDMSRTKVQVKDRDALEVDADVIVR